jgi:acyl carrier protein
MIPSAFVPLEAIPLTGSGKVDLRALPVPTAAAGSREYVAPRNDEERALAGMWAEVLGVERVGITDDFFALGGHSLMATRVMAWIRRTFDVEVPLQALWETPTVAGLAIAVAEAHSAVPDDEDEDLADLLAELEGLSDEEAERLLASERRPPGRP